MFGASPGLGYSSLAAVDTNSPVRLLKPSLIRDSRKSLNRPPPSCTQRVGVEQVSIHFSMQRGLWVSGLLDERLQQFLEEAPSILILKCTIHPLNSRRCAPLTHHACLWVAVFADELHPHPPLEALPKRCQAVVPILQQVTPSDRNKAVAHGRSGLLLLEHGKRHAACARVEEGRRRGGRGMEVEAVADRRSGRP